VRHSQASFQNVDKPVVFQQACFNFLHDVGLGYLGRPSGAGSGVSNFTQEA
jgi:hypothetical protein